MKFPLLPLKARIPFDALLEHAEKLKECAWVFQQAMECHATVKCRRFEEYMQEVDNLESEADSIKRDIRSSIPKRAKMPVTEYQLFMYIKEQDKVLDSVNEALTWISFRPGSRIPEALKKDFFDLVNAVIAPIEELSVMVVEASKYFESYSNKQCDIVKGIINNLRESEHEADEIEDRLKLDIFMRESDAIEIYHMITLADIIGKIADHAENAGDIMRAMIS